MSVKVKQTVCRRKNASRIIEVINAVEKSSEVVGILLAIAKCISESQLTTALYSKGNCENYSKDSGPKRCFTALKT